MKRLAISCLSLVPCLLFLCLSDTAFAQPTLTFSDPNDANNPVDPNHPLSFSVALGNTTLRQVTLTASQATSVTFVVDKDPSTGQPWTWLKLGPSSNSLGSSYVTTVNPAVTLTLGVLAQGLSTGTYHASFSVGITGQATSQTIGVNLTVNGGTNLSTSQSNINFTATLGSNTSSPTSVPVQINSASGALAYTVTSTYSGQ